MDMESSMPTRQPSRAASRAGAGTPLPTAPVEDAGDREAMRHLSAVMREQLSAVIVPLFKMDRTQLEQQKEAAKAREAAEAAAAAASANGAPPSPAAPTPSKAPAKAAPAAPASKAAAAAGADKTLPTLSYAELEEKVDLELFRPPGLDPHLYTDVLKMRTQRIAAERQLKSLQQQLVQSRQLVSRRTNEGASKAALKKSEKTLSALKSTLKDMQRQRETQESRKKSETPQPQAKGSKSGSTRR
jgi:hypothetical protein